MSALQLFRGLPQTKQEINDCKEALKQEILSGEYNPLEIDLLFKKMEEVLSIREDKEVKQAVLMELSKYSDKEKTIKIDGCEVTKRQSVSYSYDLCGDSVLVQLQNQYERIGKELKERQKMLQMLHSEMVNPETGEVIYPAEKSSKDSYAIKIL